MGTWRCDQVYKIMTSSKFVRTRYHIRRFPHILLVLKFHPRLIRRRKNMDNSEGGGFLQKIWKQISKYEDIL